eukprot:TRINITY_DN3342_c0_g1_i1.p2 TRINITY_DN3342_c0_g1~~TRINITY_DN3342_c0_g1_i1.p2  ORF type:complete len:299 (-),score=95.22 TRINITY_DN3342_c0_g1_i1:45-941(-)
MLVFGLMLSSSFCFFAAAQSWRGHQDPKIASSDLRGVRFDHVTYKTPVLDPATKFYSDLLQMPLVRHIPNDTDYLGVGSDAFFGLQINDPAYIDHFCLGLEAFDTEHVISTLKAFNLTASGIYENTLRFEDPNGLHIQLCNGDYAQNQTWDLDPSKQIPTQFNALQAVTIDHITIKVPDLEKTSLFYQKLFNLPLLRVIPGNTHYLGIGNNSFFGIQPSGSDKAWIDHFCIGLQDFNTEQIENKITSLGATLIPPSYINTVRFTDPWGYHIQLCSTDYAYVQTHISPEEEEDDEVSVQ